MFALLAMSASPSLAWGAEAPPSLSAGLAALEASDYATAAEMLAHAARGADQGPALLGLARAQLATGKYAEAERTAAQAIAVDRRLRADGLALRAEALVRQGKLADAIRLLEPLRADSDAVRARVELGELYIAAGRRADAEAPLLSVIDDYNNDKIAASDAEGLTLVGRAARLLRSPRDANDAYNQAERAGPHRVETLLARAELFLGTYDPGHAEEVVREALKLAPHNALCHVAMARIKLDQALDFEAAEHELDEALATNPRLAEAFMVRAGLALRDMDLAKADASVDAGLAITPGDLDLLSMRAAVRFLAGDRAGYERARQVVFAKNAEFSRFYRVVGEFAEWEHRYDEIVTMMREATRVDPADARAWADLGLNLIRGGHEADGVAALRRAWEKDHFNVRVFNTLNLYEKDIPRSYETVEGTPFRIRYAKSEKKVLERYVPAMLKEAWESMLRRYGFVPETPIFIELYATAEQFSVRTSGLPNVGIQGVCFGKTLAAMSPRAEPFNWGNVLWHELSHVFAIQLSKSRVPRWFTEGLSEYETIVRRPEWQREEDPALYAALRAGRIPPILQLNQAFTHADDAGDVMMAYYAASQLQVFLVEKFGMPKIVQMLRLWGDGLGTADVIERALGVGGAELDRQFRGWLTPRLARYERQYVPDLRAPPLAQAQARVKTDTSSARAHVELALALGASKHDEDAQREIAEALALDPLEPDARMLDAKLRRAKGDIDGAKAELTAMARSGSDGYAVRMALFELAAEQHDPRGGRANLEIAHAFDPTMVDAVRALYELAKREKRDADALGWLREVVRLDQHDRKSYALLLEQLVQAGQWAEAVALGESAIFVDPESSEIHTLYASALSARKQHPKAIFELESALLCAPPAKEKGRLHAMLAREYLAVGKNDQARAERDEALKIDPESVEAKQLAVP